MILLDTNIIIDFWKSHGDAVAEVLRRSDVYICGVTLAELMQGALDAKDCEQIRARVGKFTGLNVTDEDWASLGRNLYLLRKAGTRVPFQDALLATMAIQHEMELWSFDGHFPMIQAVLPELKLFTMP